jgi:2-oxo-4-hydroxy-4-carboxy--5-ureidoimidazoline (OHCU) decarboxylase
VRELPRQLDADELERLFENRTLAERLAAVGDPLGRARQTLASLTEKEQVEALSAHPPIGATHGVSAASALEQGAEADPAVLAELAELNRAYEERFGFRFVVFVNRRPRAAIVPILRERLERTRAEELGTGLDELVAIALDRWRNG